MFFPRLDASLFPILALLSSVTAQAELRFARAEDLIIGQIDGPRTFIQRFAGTHWGRMLGSDEFAELWVDADPYVSEFRGQFESLLGFDVAELWSEVQRYGGRISIAVNLDAAAFHHGEGEMDVVVSFEPEANSDSLVNLKSVLTDCLVDRLTDVAPWSADRRLSVGKLAGFEVLVPAMIDDHLVVVRSTDLARRAPDLLDRDEAKRPAPAERDRESGLWVRLDPKVLDMLALGVVGPNIGDPDNERNVGQVAAFDQLLAPGIRAMQIRVLPDEQFVRQEFDVRFDPKNPGLVALLQPKQVGPHPLLPFVPRDHESWTAMSFDVAKAWELAGEIAVKLVDVSQRHGEADPLTVAEAQFKSITDYELRTELLDRLTGDVVYFNDARQSAEVLANPDAFDDDDAELPGLVTFAIGIREAAEFEAMVEAILRSRGLHAARRTREYGGVRIRSMPLLGVITVHYAFAGDVLLVGAGARTESLIRAMIDQRQAGADGAQLTAWPDSIRNRMDRLSDGWRDVGAGRAAVDPEALVAMLVAEFEDRDTKVEDEERTLLRRAIQLLLEHDLLVTVDAISFTEGRVRFERIN